MTEGIKVGSFGICHMEYDIDRNQIYLKLIRKNKVYFHSVIRNAYFELAHNFISDADEEEIKDIYINKNKTNHGLH